MANQEHLRILKIGGCGVECGQGIIDAATAVGVAGKPVIDLTREVMRLLGA